MKRGSLSEPGFDVLLEGLLRCEAWSNDDDGTIGKQPGEKHGQERVGGGADGVERQRLPLLHALAQRLHGGRRSNGREQFAGRPN